MKRFMIFLGKILVFGLSALVFTSQMGFAKNLRLLSAYPRNMAFVEGCVGTFNQNLSMLSKGKLTTNYSGPEVVPTIEQFQPMQSGIFDMLFTIGAYHLGTTAIGAAVDAIDNDPVKRRQHGLFDFIDRHYNRLGVKVVAIIPVTDLHFLTRVPLDGRTPSLAGLKLRAAPTIVPAVKLFGGSPVNLGPGDVYTSLQKGVIDGVAMISYGAWNYKWHEVTSYMVRPTFAFLSTYLFMNLKKYESLTDLEKRVIDEAGRLTEIEASDHFKNQKEAEFKKLKQAGLKETHMLPADAAKFNLVINKVIWTFAKQKSGADAAELHKLALAAGLAK